MAVWGVDLEQQGLICSVVRALKRNAKVDKNEEIGIRE